MSVWVFLLVSASVCYLHSFPEMAVLCCHTVVLSPTFQLAQCFGSAQDERCSIDARCYYLQQDCDVMVILSIR